MKKLTLEDYFTYHPPKTEFRKQAHNEINQKAYEFAKAVDEFCEDESCKNMSIFAIQQARMFANQGITIDELRDFP